MKVGDIVICVDNSNTNLLRLNGMYKISCLTKNIFNLVVYIGVNDEDSENWDSNRFVLLKENRKQKLKKICLNQEIK